VWRLYSLVHGLRGVESASGLAAGSLVKVNQNRLLTSYQYLNGIWKTCRCLSA
jgi:hypothetical protein